MWSLVDLSNMRWNVFSSTDFDLNVPDRKVLFGVPVPREKPRMLLPDFRESKKLLGSVSGLFSPHPTFEKVPLDDLRGSVVHFECSK